MPEVWEYQGGQINNVSSWKGVGYKGIVDAKMLLFIDLWKTASRGLGDYNYNTGYFELYKSGGGIDDITYNEAVEIYSRYSSSCDINEVYSFDSVRANLPFMSMWNGNIFRAFELNKKLDVAYIDGFISKPADYAFYGCISLRKILGTIRFEGNISCAEMFYNCKKLDSVNINGLRRDITFAWSPLLSIESIKYLIDNEKATQPIVITLHTDAYTRAMADAGIQASLAAHPNISLASA